MPKTFEDPNPNPKCCTGEQLALLYPADTTPGDAVEDEHPVSRLDVVKGESIVIWSLSYAPLLEHPPPEDTRKTARAETGGYPVGGAVESDVGHGRLSDGAVLVVEDDL